MQVRDHPACQSGGIGIFRCAYSCGYSADPVTEAAETEAQATFDVVENEFVRIYVMQLKFDAHIIRSQIQRNPTRDLRK